jgi:hypothetical protein
VLATQESKVRLAQLAHKGYQVQKVLLVPKDLLARLALMG